MLEATSAVTAQAPSPSRRPNVSEAPDAEAPLKASSSKEVQARVEATRAARTLPPSFWSKAGHNREASGHPRSKVGTTGRALTTGRISSPAAVLLATGEEAPPSSLRSPETIETAVHPATPAQAYATSTTGTKRLTSASGTTVICA